MESFNDCIIDKIDYDDTNEHGYKIIVPASNGFNYPYILFIPYKVNIDTTLIVEGANSNETSHSIKDGVNKVIDESMDRIITKCNSETNFPILTPAFPRFYDKELDKIFYTHMLTSDILKYENNGLKRIDLQLINMINDAKKRLKGININIEDKIIIDGFSASSKFANRFALLHPEIVKLVIAGGVSGTLILPIKEMDGEKLLYPIGCGDIDFIDDDKIELFRTIPQFYYMGDSDLNDPFGIKKDGTFNNIFAINTEEREQLFKYIGKDIDIRWKNIQKIYNNLGINARFKTYENCGHSPISAKNDVINILKNSNNELYIDEIIIW